MIHFTLGIIRTIAIFMIQPQFLETKELSMKTNVCYQGKTTHDNKKKKVYMGFSKIIDPNYHYKTLISNLF